jgi:hypothetical protein
MWRVGCPGRVCWGWDSHMTIARWLLVGCCSRGSELSVHACWSQRRISGLVGGEHSRGSRFDTRGVVRVGASARVPPRIRRRCGLLAIRSRSGGLLARWLRHGPGGRSHRSQYAGRRCAPRRRLPCARWLRSGWPQPRLGWCGRVRGRRTSRRRWRPAHLLGGSVR